MKSASHIGSVAAILVAVLSSHAFSADDRVSAPRVISADDPAEVKSAIASSLFSPEVTNAVDDCRQRRETSNETCQSVIPSRAVPVGFTFESGSAVLSPQSKRVLDGIGEILAARRSYFASLMVEGHTDSTGSSARNIILSRERAESVRRYLSDAHGIKNIDTKGWGSQYPLVRDNPKAAANRRIEFRVQYP